MYAFEEYPVPGPTGMGVRLKWRGLPPLRVIAAHLGSAALLMQALVLVVVEVCFHWLRWKPLVFATDLPPAGMAALGGGCVAGAVCLFLLALPDSVWYTSRITWDAREGVLEIRYACLVPLLFRSRRIPFAQVRHVLIEEREAGAFCFVRVGGAEAALRGTGALLLPLRLRGDGLRELSQAVRGAMGWEGLTEWLMQVRRPRSMLRFISLTPTSQTVPA